MVVYYVIASNIGLAIMMIIVYARYSKFRLSSAKEIEELQKKISQEIEHRKSLQERLFLETRTDHEKIQTLLTEIDELRKEKEGELKLRLEAQKRLELAEQTFLEVEKRAQELSEMRQEVIKDSREVIVKIGNDLFKKLNDTYKNEAEANKNLLGKFSKNITDFMEKSISSISKPKIVKKVVATKTDEKPAATNDEKPIIKTDLVIKSNPSKLLPELVKTMKANGWLANKEYFTAENFSAQNAQMFFCDVAFISLDKLYVVDFKASEYFAEFANSKDEATLKQKLDRYFEYLQNQQYLESILQVMATTGAKFTSKGIVIALDKDEDLKAIKDLGYYDKARKIASEVLSLNGVNNLIL